MKLRKIDTKAEKHLAGLYTVDEISPKDIASPSENFLKVSRNLRSFSLNRFTIGEFNKELKRSLKNSNR
jgi:hypothetical protein